MEKNHIIIVKLETQHPHGKGGPFPVLSSESFRDRVHGVVLQDPEEGVMDDQSTPVGWKTRTDQDLRPEPEELDQNLCKYVCHHVVSANTSLCRQNTAQLRQGHGAWAEKLTDGRLRKAPPSHLFEV